MFTHQADSQNSDTTAPCGRELYHLQFSLQQVSPETFGYTLVYSVFTLKDAAVTSHSTVCFIYETESVLRYSAIQNDTVGGSG
jgi:hypothetical protein